MNSSKKNWELISRKVVYDGYPYIKVSIDKVKLPTGKIINDYHRIEVHNAVMLLVENNENKLLVYKEYRHGVSEVSLTFPAGGIEKGESIYAAAERELNEETGYTAKKFHLLSDYVVSGSYMFGELSFIRVRDIHKKEEPKAKDIEDPEHIWMAKDEIKNSIKNKDFKALTYATAAMQWILEDER
tara:strand:- start:2630 stop:3184 length:555 start_codon:yes stop_codon:yes gene_type:complete